MANRLRETLVTDGATTIFNTQATYRPTTVFVYWNGQLMSKDFVVELGGTTFEVCEVAEADESMQVEYESIL